MNSPVATGRRRGPVRTILPWALAVVGVAGLSVAFAGANPELGLRPENLPNPLDLTITSLPDLSPEGHNARIDVVYAKGHGLPERVPLDIDGRRLHLIQDPKNSEHYRLALPFDFQSFVAEQRRRQELSPSLRPEPVFAGRHVVGHQSLRFLDPSRLIRQIENNTPIVIPGGVLTGTSSLINAAASLMVIDPLVVEDPIRTYDVCTDTGDPNGAWSFKTLVTQIANEPVSGIHPADMVRHWIESWADLQVVNEFNIPPRSPVVDMVLENWELDGGGRLDLNKAPMRLLAIVNRVDLRGNSFYGGGTGGEGRFVFGVMRRDGGGNCTVEDFTVILEYGVPISGCSNVKNYGQQWVDLDTFPIGSPAYNAALQDITDIFTAAGAAPDKPNGSALNQLRTNEFVTPGQPWELREFVVSADTGLLQTVTAKMTPHRATFNEGAGATSPLLAEFINDNIPNILANNYEVPETYPQAGVLDPVDFLTGSAINIEGVWQHSLIEPSLQGTEARRIFSLNTCDGCHRGETQTSFLHIRPRAMTVASQLSRFLVGDSPGSVDDPGLMSMTIPVSGGLIDYGDLVWRQQDLDELVSTSCLSGGIVDGLLFPASVSLTH